MPRRDSQETIVDSDEENNEPMELLEDDTTDSPLFSSQAPELTQDINPVKDAERTNLMNLSVTQREKAIHDLSRLILFKALTGDSIDRAKCIKEANIQDAKITTAAFDEANLRLQHCFGFQLRRIPAWMEAYKSISKTLKERYYVMNAVQDDTGHHSRQLHSGAIEHGLLMLVLAFCYCKGQARNDGSRWMYDGDLYRLLHRLDENLPNEPPAPGSKRKQGSSTVTGNTPNVDVLLEQFVHRNYLLKEKVVGDPDLPENAVFYSMGPRAGIEIGRKQVLYFCAEILDEEVTPGMIQELEGEEGDEDWV